MSLNVAFPVFSLGQIGDSSRAPSEDRSALAPTSHPSSLVLLTTLRAYPLLRFMAVLENGWMGRAWLQN